MLRWRKRGNVSAPSPPTFYYRRGTFRIAAILTTAPDQPVPGENATVDHVRPR